MKRIIPRRRVSRRSLFAGAGAATLGGLLTACGGSDDSSGSDLSEHRVGAMDGYDVGDQFRASQPLTFSIMMQDHPAYPYDPDWMFWSELTARTNVTLDNVVVPFADYNERRGVMIAGGDAPMILPRTYAPDEEQFIAGGAILPVSDYVHLMPHYQATITRWQLEGDVDSRRQADGKYYLLPGLHEDVSIDNSLAMRTDILEELDLEVPETWDDVAEVLREMKRAYPDLYPFSERWSTPPEPGANNLLNMLAQAHGTAAGWGWQPAIWDTVAGRFVFPAAMDQYRQILEYLNTLVSEELLDPESFTQPDDTADEKFAAGRSFVISTNAQLLIDRREDIASIPGATVRKIPPPLGPMGNTKQGSRLENGIMISTRARESENFVAMMQFIDWLWYSDEGKLFAKWGVEGETYTGSVEDGTFALADDVQWAGLNPDAEKLLNADYGFFNGIFVYGGSTALLHSQFPEEEQEFQAVMSERETMPVSPPRPLTAEERERASLMETGLRDHVDQETLKFILGQRSFGEWDEFVNELRSRNMDDYIDMVNGAYERYEEEHG